MNYFASNKEAWNEVFAKHQKGYKPNPIHEQLKHHFSYIDNNLKQALELIGYKNKNIAQFCCNNSREILSIVNSGAKSGVGFDISENFINEGNTFSLTTTTGTIWFSWFNYLPILN
ncbi:MAG: hypothetical protein JW841_14385 [Deltaproteobacteria bacterium]|nr:hypothetical protein [Deltaproteobacteria bacterium]